MQSRSLRAQQLRLVTDLEPLAHERGWAWQTLTPKSRQRIVPSRGLAEDVCDIVRNGQRRVAEHAYFSVGDQGAAIEGYFARLYAGMDYAFPATFHCCVPDALLVGELGIAITANGEVLSQSALCRSSDAMWRAIRDVGEGQHLPGEYLSLLTIAANSYAHWLLDSLPRLAALNCPERITCIIPERSTAFQRETLSLLGVSPDRIIGLASRTVGVERLHLVHAADSAVDPHPSHLLALRARLLAAAGASHSSSASRRIYVSRSRSLRPIINESDLMPVLKAFGYEVIHAETLTFAEQVRMFAEAKIVLGAHGAGMHNHIFGGAETTVVELFNPRLWTLSVCRTASVLGHRHWHTFVENVGNKLETHVEPRRLATLLARVEAN